MRRSVRSRTLAAFATCVLAAGSLATVSALVTAAPARALDLAGTPPALGSKYCFDSQEGVFRVPNGAADVVAMPAPSASAAATGATTTRATAVVEEAPPRAPAVVAAPPGTPAPAARAPEASGGTSQAARGAGTRTSASSAVAAAAGGTK